MLGNFARKNWSSTDVLLAGEKCMYTHLHLILLRETALVCVVDGVRITEL